MLKPESGAPLGDPALSQDDALQSVSERLTNERPLFKTDAHLCGLSLGSPVSSW